MKTLDLKRELRNLYAASPEAPVIVEVPQMRFLMVDGRGDPSAPAFGEAVGALYQVAYGAKFLVAGSGGPRYVVPPLEALWGMDDDGAFDAGARDRWRWTAMIMQPPQATDALVDQAREQARRKRPSRALADLRFEAFDEGLSAQIMHIGPYATEPATIARLVRFIADEGYQPNGRHHEIYLGDPRRVAPERLRTLIRHPVRRAG
ncbi:MAG: GyrI-like domain-containing protein [Gaiellales bacterium]